MKGKLVVFEGLDKVGKTTQIQILSEIFAIEEIKHKVIKFPAKNTPTWDILDSYDSEIIDLDPHSAHLIYCANFWQLQTTIKNLLDDSFIVLVDRYLFSGIAYSVGYHKLDLDWCINSMTGLIMPDIVFYFYVSEQEQCKRKLGQGRFESIETQRNVGKVYNLIDNGWVRIDANGSKSEISLDIQSHIKNLLEL